MGRPAGWLKEVTGRNPMLSLGAPKSRRSIEQAFWQEIATGASSEDAAAAVGVSQAVGGRWFRQGGGMPAITLTLPGGRCLTFAECEEIAPLRAQNVGVREIARILHRDASTVSRDFRRNAATCGGRLLDSRALVAQWKAELMECRPKTAKLVDSPRLRAYVQECLDGRVRSPDGALVGPVAPAWKARNKPHRRDRACSTAWSADQISQRLKLDFPDDESMRISHEAIYQALYVQGRGALKRELVAELRTGRSLRKPRARA